MSSKLRRKTAGADDLILCVGSVLPDASWLDRLSAAAFAGETFGIVAPLERDLSDNDVAGSLDPALAAAVNQGVVIAAIPERISCIYVKRSCLDALGKLELPQGLDRQAALKAICLRAVSLGCQVGVAADVLALPTKPVQVDLAREKFGRYTLDALFPGYVAFVDDTASKSAMRVARRRVAEARTLSMLRNTDRQGFQVIVTLAQQGGVSRHVREQVDHLRDQGIGAIELRPESTAAAPGRCRLAIGGHETEELIYELPEEMGSLVAFLGQLRVVKVAIHHLMQLPTVILELPERLGVPYEVTIHDYSWICPRITLIPERRYCGEPEVAVCERCIADHGGLLGEPIRPAALRQRSRMVLQGAQRVIAPSVDAQRRIEAYFPTVRVDVQPWEVTPPSPDRLARAQGSSEPIRVAVIGAIGIQKGFDLIEAAASDAARRGLPLMFVVIGHTMDNAALAEVGPVDITGEFAEAEIDAIITAERCDISLFASIWPETWCYSLTHAMRHGLPIVAPRIGAFPERLADYGPSRLFDPASVSAIHLNELLIELASSNGTWHNPPPRDTKSALHPIPAASDNGKDRNAADVHLRSLNVINQSVASRPEPNRATVTSTIQTLKLADGLYAFTIRAAENPPPPAGEIVVPAIRVVPAPLSGPSGRVSLLGSPAAFNDWLTKTGDVVTVQVTGGPCDVVLLSLSAPGCIPLNLDVRRLDQQSAAPTQAAPQPAQAPRGEVRPMLPPTGAPPASLPSAGPPAPGQRRAVRAQILTHIQNRGDLPFVSGNWAGMRGQRLWIEAFAVTPLENWPSDAFEYKGRTAGGFETPWLSNGAWCGTRGMGVPLVEFGIRLRPQLAATHDCEYSGAFFSGSVIGPVKNGVPCRSATANDPLEAIQVNVVEKTTVGIAAGSYIGSPGGPGGIV